MPYETSVTRTEPTRYLIICLRGMTDSRHSERGSKFNDNKVVEIIYKMCYGRSQKCKFFQKAHGFFSKVNDDGTYTSLKFLHIF